MEDYEDFTPIIECGIEYSGVSAFKVPLGVPSPRTPSYGAHLPPASPHSSQKKLPIPSTPTRSGSFSAGNGKLLPASTPTRQGSFSAGSGKKPVPKYQNGLISHSKSLTYPGNINYGAENVVSTPSPWRSGRGPEAGIPRAPVKNHATSNGNGPDASTPSPWRSVPRGGEAGSSGAPVKQGSAEYRLSNGFSHSHSLDSSPATKSAPIRHLSFSRCSFKQVSVDIRRLRQFARQGSWKLLIERVKDAQRRGLLSTPDQEIAYGTYHLLALMQLQDYRAAAQEIAAFGDLNAPHYRYENHPELYPEKSGSMVPFALRCMHAELPHRVGQTGETLYRLYNLLAHCDSQIDVLQAERSLDPAERPESISTSTSDTDTQARIEPVNDEEIVVASLHTDDLESMADTEIEMANLHIDDESIAESDIAILEGLLATWRRRKEAVCFSIVGYHMHQQQFLVALQWLDKLIAKSPSDPHVKTKAALVQLQLGDVQGAQRTFSDVEALVSSPSSSSPELRNLVRRNRGILNVALGQFPEAIAEFDAVLAKDPHDIVSINNKALCLLYNQQLLDATDTLEDAIFKGPRRLVNEAVIANVCSMYEVVSFSGAAAKRSLRTWMKENGPDDFEPSSFRL
ncbi:hypothetical protein KC19_2G142200 [Ceratodon purpureus]|uniref:Uncharacterized protein n=1 Tax=Ceratodon purpureus TaxID=3225 RepID=A0A8T0IVF1_CERPU|nr:hypothetical protein KC19_2G142200 [Ceratodon purpureus]